MSLAPGTSFRHYEILQLLGAGGMGEVYRARDTKLGRDVALKVLPDVYANDPERLARFQREATTLATLNHPHIAQIHGVEESEGTRALVMELVEGEDVAERVARGAIPIDLALTIASQIAEGLEGAHAAGIVHRDLKPANIKLRRDGTIKILDFGLAKLVSLETGSGRDGSGLSSSARDSPTVTSPATNEGVILGSAAYMAPEQAKGHPVDRRADIWAFGCVLFEMLTGRRCFRAASVTETLVLVLEREPNWNALPAATPEGLRRLLKRCLQKDPKRRLHDIADARIEIEEIAAAPPVSSAPWERSPLSMRSVLWLAGLALTGLTFALIKLPARPEGEAPDAHVYRLTDLFGLEETPALSPDGKSVAFAASTGGIRQIFVQLIAGGTPLQITREPIDHQNPRWSADSSSIVYFSPARPGDTQGSLWQISALGGVSRRIAGSMGGADVNLANRRLAFFRLDKSIQLVTAADDGSRIELVAEFEPARYYLSPRWSPDGKWIAFQRGDSIRFDLFVVPTTGGKPRQLTHENNMIGGLAWLPDGSGLLYSSGRGDTMPYLPTLALWRVSLDDGSVRQVTSGENSYIAPDVAKNGTIVAARMRLQTDIWRYPIDGAPADNVGRGVRITRQTGSVLTPTVSPGDTEVAFLSDRGGHANLWVINVESGERRQITFERDPTVAVGVPVWSPDGRAIAFVYTRGNPGLTFGVWLVDPDGSNLRQLANPALGPAWSHDGRWVYFSTRGDIANADIVLKKIPVEGGSAITVTTERIRNAIGSDGSSLYYTFERALVDGTPEFEIRSASPEDGPHRVLARISPSRVPMWQIVNPALSPDGNWLAQALTDGVTTNIWALSTSSGQWRQITDFGDRPTFIARRVSWSSDGRSVLAAVSEGDADVVLLDGFLNASRD
jgi:eukaryotic-like serine/threonine-protein kinase